MSAKIIPFPKKRKIIPPETPHEGANENCWHDWSWPRWDYVTDQYYKECIKCGKRMNIKR